MKRLYSILSVTVIFATVNTLMAQASFKMPDIVTKVHNQINVSVIPQIELISIIQTISIYPTVFDFLMAKDSSDYKADVINHFKHFKNHPAVHMFERLSLQPRMLNFSAPSNIMLYTNENLNLRTDIKLDDFVVSRAAGMDSLKGFLSLLRDFASESSFNEFYLKHRDFYLNIIENTTKNLGPTNYISELENFYGKKQESYNIVLVSLYNYVGYGNSLLCLNDKREIYNTMGPGEVINNIPFFGDENYLKYFIWHEFSHPFINPLTEKYWDYIKDYSNKYDSIPEVAHKNVCGDWQECINEFIIRSITTQIAYNEGDDSGLKAYKIEKSTGVSYLDSLLGKIRFYQANRNIYPTFESFYLNILDVFKE
jgi:hypothetical protein